MYTVGTKLEIMDAHNKSHRIQNFLYKFSYKKKVREKESFMIFLWKERKLGSLVHGCCERKMYTSCNPILISIQDTLVISTWIHTCPYTQIPRRIKWKLSLLSYTYFCRFLLRKIWHLTYCRLTFFWQILNAHDHCLLLAKAIYCLSLYIL